MSLEAWGDEGNFGSRWEETAMYEDFHAAYARFRKWRDEYKKDAGTPDLEKAIDDIYDAFDTASLMMEGPF